jgi:acyl dehydratase
MPLSTDVVGREVPPLTTPITLRRIMAYAASVGDHNMRYFDDTGAAPVVAQPIFGVSLDFPMHEALEEATGLTRSELDQQVHATQDMIFHRPVRVGDVLTTRGFLAGAEQRSPGAYLVLRFETADAVGQPVLSADFGLLFRGVPCEGPARWLERRPELPATIEIVPGDWSVAVPIPWGLPHVYSECAQIYFAIHTERAFARVKGLPDIILHGTATLAIATRELIDRECAGDPGRLARISARFAGMVVPDSEITVRLDERARTADGRLLRFTVLNDAGQPAVRDGVALVREG